MNSMLANLKILNDPGISCYTEGDSAKFGESTEKIEILSFGYISQLYFGLLGHANISLEATQSSV